MVKYLENVEDYNNLVKEADLVLVDFFAEWCGPCKMMGPVLDELAEDKKIAIVKVNVDKFQDLSKEHGIMSIPTLFLYQNGEIIKKTAGYVPKQLLEKWISVD